jgi:phospholipase D1/2
MSHYNDDDLAYGEYHDRGEAGAEGDRGFVGDVFRRMRGNRQDEGQNVSLDAP